MGWKYEVETYFYEVNDWSTGYMGNSLFNALRSLLRAKKRDPGRAYRITVR